MSTKTPAKKLAADIITVDMSQVDSLVQQGSDIVATPEAEQALLALVELEKRITTAVKEAKRRIEEQALEYNPNFTSVQATRLKIGYQFFGAKYRVDPTNVDKLPKDIYKQETKFSIITPALKRYLKDNENKLPLGIIERDRAKSITISPIEQYDEEADV